MKRLPTPERFDAADRRRHCCRALACDEDLPGDLDPTPSIVLTEIDLDCEGECAMRFDACYNVNMTESLQCCQEGTSCIVKDKWYAQCLATEDAEMNINMGWDGRCALALLLFCAQS